MVPINFWGPECQRNAIPAKSSRVGAASRVYSEADVPDLVDGSKGQAVLEALVAGSTFDLRTEETRKFVDEVCSILKGQVWDPSDSFCQDSLYNLTLRVRRCSAVQSAVDFTYMTSLMQVSAKDVSCVGCLRFCSISKACPFKVEVSAHQVLRARCRNFDRLEGISIQIQESRARRSSRVFLQHNGKRGIQICNSLLSRQVLI